MLIRPVSKISIVLLSLLVAVPTLHAFAGAPTFNAHMHRQHHRRFDRLLPSA